jgi:photosystem II stability/assembly factor-like uncharacterized protein
VSRRIRWAAALTAAIAVQLAVALPAQAQWSQHGDTNTTNALRDVNCPSANRCYAVGAGGTIVSNSGATSTTWQSQNSCTPLFLYGLDCLSESTCVAAGDSGVIVRTTNSGASWTIERPGTTGAMHLIDVTCPGSNTCIAVGHGGTVLKSTDSGDTWSSQTTPTTKNLFGIDCPTTNLCWAVGDGGTILLGQQQTNGPAWAQQSSGTTEVLDGISCATATSCRVTGAGGTILGTDTAGAVWDKQTSPTGNYLFDVECTTPATCWAVGSSGTIVGTLNGGTTWEPESSSTGESLFGVGCVKPSLCKAVGFNGEVVTRGGVATGHSSADCDTAAGSTTIADGYADGVYVNAKTATPGGGRVWVCYRVDNGTNVKTGGLVEIDVGVGVEAPTTDTFSEACSTTPNNDIPGPHPLRDIEIGDPEGSPYIPIMLDTYRNNEVALVCLRAGNSKLRVRVPLPDAQVPAVTYYPDNPGTTPPPDPPPNEPSGTCQTAGGNRILNMDLGSSHIWLYTLQPASNQANVCVRAQSGTVGIGGKLSVIAQVGVPVRPTIDDTDMSPCTVQLIDDSGPPPYRISISPPGTFPASVCVEQGTTKRRVTLDVDPGGLVLPVVDWTGDTGTPG